MLDRAESIHCPPEIITTPILKKKTQNLKSSDAGNLDMPKRNSKMFPFIEKVKVFNIERKLYAKVTTVKSVHERAWQAPVHEVVRVRQNLVTEAPPPLMKL